MAVAEAVATRTQSEEAYARILERIVSLEMAPGSVVNEARLREGVDGRVELLKPTAGGGGHRAGGLLRRYGSGFEREIRTVLVEGGWWTDGEDLFRDRPARLGGLLEEVPERGQVLQRRRAH